jgi:hypothetical protein
MKSMKSVKPSAADFIIILIKEHQINVSPKTMKLISTGFDLLSDTKYLRPDQKKKKISPRKIAANNSR